MPNTQNYSFSFESPGSRPGTTLTGGPEGGNAILARQVDTALAAVETKVDVNTTNITANAGDIDAVESDVQDLTNWIRTGTELVSFTSQSSFTVVVPFGFTFPSPPAMSTEIVSGSGTTARWGSRAINITTSQFTLFVFGNNDGGTTDTTTWDDIPVSWIAIYRP